VLVIQNSLCAASTWEDPENILESEVAAERMKWDSISGPVDVFLAYSNDLDRKIRDRRGGGS